MNKDVNSGSARQLELQKDYGKEAINRTPFKNITGRQCGKPEIQFEGGALTHNFFIALSKAVFY